MASVLELGTIALDDEAVYDLICEVDTIGLFQVESRAQASALPRVRPRMLRGHRRAGRDHPARPAAGEHGESVHQPPAGSRAGDLRASARSSRALKETLGVILFQEQILRVAMAVAGFSPPRRTSCAAR
jgi:error-prone DNA polymerase